jgi:hypothetical protein
MKNIPNNNSDVGIIKVNIIPRTADMIVLIMEDLLMDLYFPETC